MFLFIILKNEYCSNYNFIPAHTILFNPDYKYDQCILGVLVLQLKVQKIVSEYDQEIPQSQTADNSVASRGRAAQPSRDTRKTN